MVEGARKAVIIDDDPDVRLMLRVALEASGLVVHEATTGHGGVHLVAELRPDLVTLDLVLPGFGGVEVCRRIREISDAYVIIITASSDEVDRLVGLATGADDYVLKPFSPREVQARVMAMFRRPRTGIVPAKPSGLIAPALPAPPNLGFGPVGFDPPGPAVGSDPPVGALIPASRSAEPESPTPQPIQDGEPGIVRHGPLVVDLEGRVAWHESTELPLTKIEFDLLITMMGNPRRVWRRETLLNIVWGGQWSDHHVVEVHIGNLRRKLAGASPDGGQLIKTVRGIGYRMLSLEPQPRSRTPQF
jgi:two-component system OmpR family response regulator